MALELLKRAQINIEDIEDHPDCAFSQYVLDLQEQIENLEETVGSWQLVEYKNREEE